MQQQKTLSQKTEAQTQPMNVTNLFHVPHCGHLGRTLNWYLGDLDLLTLQLHIVPP